MIRRFQIGRSESPGSSHHNPAWKRGARSLRSATPCAVAVLIAHAALLGWMSSVNSPNLDEPAHLASGIHHWNSGRFELYRVNPPLVRMVAAFPVLASAARTDRSLFVADSPYDRPEFKAGSRFVAENGMAGFRLFTLARWACIPLCLAGAWCVFCWAKQLYGAPSGLLAILLYCVCPNLMAWGASITPDAVAASLGVIAAHAFWKWVTTPSWRLALPAGIALGLAELAKGTWIILFVLWPAVWLMLRISSVKPPEGSVATTNAVPSRLDDRRGITMTPPFRQLAVILLVALYLLNLGYGFEGSFTRLGEYRFISKALSGRDHPPAGANRFEGTWLGALPVPFPENYVLGIDVQKCSFERHKWSYLCGDQRKGGWWYYYLFAMLVKFPLGTLALFTASTLLALFHRQYSAGWRNEVLLLIPGIAVLVLVSSQTGFSRYLRYALPVFPFLYIHISRFAISITRKRHFETATIIVFSIAAALESLSTFPHSMSFFNTISGGPLHGHHYLLDSNIDWGQDLLFLKRWYDNHPASRPFHIAYFGGVSVNPEVAGIIGSPVPGYVPSEHGRVEARDWIQPGWFAISINHLQGYRHYQSDVPRFTYFQRLQPVARTGYSIVLYHLTIDEANTFRAGLGLNRLSPVD